VHRVRAPGALSAAICVWFATGGTADAGTPWEVWPELSGFIGMTPQTRIYLDAASPNHRDDPSKELELGGYLDVSLKPILRPSLYAYDWQRSRYLWARVGYAHIAEWNPGERTRSEERGIASLWGKLELPARVWLESRLRADLRWIDGDRSERYRIRLEATRELLVLDHVVVPYLNAEVMYDTRYDGWARALAQAGAELTLTEHFRLEVYLLRQTDLLPASASLNALGVVAKLFY